MIKFTSFDEWRAKKYFSETLAAELKMYDENDSKIDMRGFIYPDGAWIELEDSGQWHTIVGNTEEFKHDIREMEHYLWSVHSHNHISTPREILCEKLSEYCDRHHLLHLSADELMVHCMERRDTFQLHIEWLEKFLEDWEASK